MLAITLKIVIKARNWMKRAKSKVRQRSIMYEKKDLMTSSGKQHNKKNILQTLCSCLFKPPDVIVPQQSIHPTVAKSLAKDEVFKNNQIDTATNISSKVEIKNDNNNLQTKKSKYLLNKSNTNHESSSEESNFSDAEDIFEDINNMDVENKSIAVGNSNLNNFNSDSKIVDKMVEVESDDSSDDDYGLEDDLILDGDDALDSFFNSSQDKFSPPMSPAEKYKFEERLLKSNASFKDIQKIGSGQSLNRDLMNSNLQFSYAVHSVQGMAEYQEDRTVAIGDVQQYMGRSGDLHYVNKDNSDAFFAIYVSCFLFFFRLYIYVHTHTHIYIYIYIVSF